MSVTSTDKGLLTPANCAIIFVDHQPQMFFGVANIDRQDLLNNIMILAKSANQLSSRSTSVMSNLVLVRHINRKQGKIYEQGRRKNCTRNWWHQRHWPCDS